MKNNFKKTISLVLTVLMLMTCWVFVAPTQADAHATINTYRTADKWGTPYWDGTDTYYSTWNSGTSYTTFTWAKHIYLDISESLQSAGYYYTVKWRYGNNTDYRIVNNGFIFGGWGLEDTSGYPSNYYTMTRMFNNYNMDASLPSPDVDGGTTQVYDSGNTSGDLYVGVSGLNWSGAKAIIWRNPDQVGADRSAYVFMTGTPKTTGTGRYTTSGAKPTDFGGWQQWKSNKWSSASDTYTTSNDSSNWSTDCYEGTWKEVAFDITIYDKSGLGNLINSAQATYTNSAKYTSDSWYNYEQALAAAKIAVTTRETNQTNLDNAQSALQTAINGLVVNKYNIYWKNADGTILETDYNVPYGTTPAYNSATPTKAATTQYSYTFTGWSPAIAPATAHTTYTAQYSSTLNKYTVTFKFNNGSSSSDTYDYGTIITVPDNSAKAPDAKYHYSYRWPADVSTEVLGNATYSEVEIATQHDWNDWTETMAPSCEGEGAKQRSCKVCDYVETGVVSPAGHKGGSPVEENRDEPECEVDGSYDTVIYCTECGNQISRVTTAITAPGHNEIIDEAVPVTCTTDGKTAGKHCDVCGEVLVAQQIIPHEGHKEEAIPAVPATCTSDGKTAGVRCSVCKTVLTAQQDVPSPGHDWLDTYTSLGNGKDGKHQVSCDVCGETKREAHTWNSGEITKDATCEGTGIIKYSCLAEGCEGIYNDLVPATGHNYGEWISEDEATCLEGGTRGHYECSVCHKYFDENKTEIADITIAALNHNIVNHQGKEATCTEDGWQAYETCSRCNYTTYQAIGSLGHDEVPHAAKAPTCTEIGWDAYETCSRCNYTTYVEKSANGHAYVDHAAKAPTCTEIGWDAYQTCENCDYTTYAEKAAAGHAYVDHDAKAPTCTEIGWAAYQTCEKCDYTTYKEKSSLGHNIVIDKAVAPDCTETGLTEGSHCTRCNDATVAQEEVPALGHDEVPHEAKAPTCTEIGWDAYVTCSRCNYTTYAEKSKNGHAYVDHAAKAPTCTEIGWDAYQTCENCSYTTYAEKKALDHDYIDHDGQDATCLVDGWKAYQTCSRCEYTTYEAIIAQGHNVVEMGAQAPTCTEIGWDAYEYCAKCDYTTYVEIPASGHNIVAVDAKEPNCTEIGWNAYEYCTKCNYTTYNELPTNGGHDLVQVDAQAVTCTEDGWNAYEYCKNCNYTTYEAITAQGHAYVDHEGKAPTCTEEGWEAYKTCENCTYTSYKTVGAFGHSVVSVPAKAPTCEDIGWEAYERCLRCSYTTYVELPSNGHSIKQHAAQAPTCTEAGWEAYEACENCNYTTKVEIPSNGHSIKQYEAQASTCAEAGWYAYEACENCNYTTKVEIPALEHKYVNHEGKDATCSEEGWKPYQTCENCNYTSYEAIPVTDHNIVNHDAKAPTCKEIGWEAYETCTMCNYTTYKELPVADHADENKDGICDDCLVNIGCKHSNIETTVVEATCLTYGKVTQTCKDCSAFISEQLIAPSGHHDHNGDGECDDCSAPVAVSTSCNCICHKESGIMRLIYSVLRTFWKLFKITKTCSCGATHY